MIRTIDLADPLADLGPLLGRNRSGAWGRTGAERGRLRLLEGSGGWWSAQAGGGAGSD